MKLLFTFIFTLIFSFNAFSQDYLPTVLEGNTWIYWYLGPNDDFEARGVSGVRISGDTILENTDYKKVHRQFFQVDDEFNWDNWASEPPFFLTFEYLYAFVREDIETKKVYARFDDEEEFLLHDFDVEVGGVLYNHFVNMHYPDDIVTVTSIENEEYLGHTFRTIRYDTDAEWAPISFYPLREGHGMYTNLFWTSPGSQLIGNSLENPVYFCTGTEEECGIERIISSTDTPSLQYEIMLFPNPTSGMITLSISDSIDETGTLQIIDLTGRVVYSNNFSVGNFTFDLDLTAGLYSAHFKQKGRLVWKDKVVILRE